jgi:hypothetical protein
VAAAHKWAFRSKLRTRAFGWRGSKTAITRLKEAVSEIKKVARTDPLSAGDGAVTLMERLWPAFQDIDTSSGALGRAVNKTLDTVIPILIVAPADPITRAAWLERLYGAVQEDGVEYLFPAEERWGEIATYPEIMNDHADRLLPIVRWVWSKDSPGGYVRGDTICLSSLLEVGRYTDLLELLSCARMKFWSNHRFGAEALVRQGLYDAAMAYAEGCRVQDIRSYDETRIDRFCEDTLIKAGREEEAYRLYGLHTAQGTTYLAAYRETLRRYPAKDKRQVLLDLVRSRGDKGKWFAAAKDAGFLDIALECASSRDAEPATLIRAARDFTASEPQFAVQVALSALRSLLSGGGYDPSPTDLHVAYGHLIAAASELGADDWAIDQAVQIAEGRCASDRENFRTALASIVADGSQHKADG